MQRVAALDSRSLADGFKQDKKTGQWSPDAAGICKTVAECHADGVGMKGEREVIDRAFIDTLQKHGCREFHVWTIDEVKDAAYFKPSAPSASPPIAQP